MAEISSMLKEALELHQNNNLDEAQEIYLKILENDPKNAEALDFLGLVFLAKGEFNKAEDYIKKAIDLNPNNYFCGNLAKVYFHKKEFNKTIDMYKLLLETDSNNVDYLFNLALSYKNIQEHNLAIEYYNKLLEIRPNMYEAFFNIASIYFDLGETDLAIKYYNKILETDPDDNEATYFIALAYMKNREYSKGWKFFENRLCRKSAVMTQEHTYPNLMKKAKLWQGEDVPDKTIYTYYEAGFGDVLMFARYLPLLQEKCKKIVLKPQQPLSKLLKENFPNIDVMEYFNQEKDVDFDYHVPLLSLPYTLGLDESNMFIFKEGYLKSNKERADFYREYFFNNDKFKVAIKWQGNTQYDWDRVIDINSFTKLFGIENTKFYSFQTFDGSEELEKINKDYDIADIGKTLENFSDTAAAIENMDLVICNDTSLVHVAAAMGKPCYVLLPYVYNWRWHKDLSHCDWYDSVKIFRQKSPGDWDGVFDEIYDYMNESNICKVTKS